MAEAYIAHPFIEKTVLLNNVLNETEELIKIFVTSIKSSGKDDASAPRTRWHQPQADAEQLPYSMFSVRCWMLDLKKTTRPIQLDLISSLKFLPPPCRPSDADSPK